ncbi:siroheme synthase CysG [Parahalioglobus pacificus]|uniref:siroheme synthase CysG n=1 Tax=Parahalioglobus pacificus TaxID=930806 RepID=UPI001671EB00|nr:siroheme synthase CysG [Halioglobus pacificus]
MDYFPVSLRLRGRHVLLVGGGSVGVRKARLMARAGAQLTVVAPDIVSELELALEEWGGTWRRKRYETADLEGQKLVIAATPDRELNQSIFEEADARNIPVNVVDDPALCTFIVPSIVDRNPITIAINSGGSSPVLARNVRTQIETLVPQGYGRLARWAGQMRERVKAAIGDESGRRHFWEALLGGAIAEQVMAGDEAGATQTLETALASGRPATGEVFLIGAGPGDPDLMTFKALRLLQRADVILYDRLVNPAIVDMARKDAERFYVGKQRDEHAVPQDRINQWLLELAQQGQCVARLKGGDPFIFGRGGEEIALLAEHQVPFQVVPAVTAASAAAAYGGIPLTHRDHAQSVRFITGHTKNGELSLDWQSMQSPAETLVFYMGLVGLPIICRELQAHGRDADTPCALVEKASTPEQRVLTGTLATMASVVEREQPKAPTLIIVGSVAGLHQSLGWFRPRG